MTPDQEKIVLTLLAVALTSAGLSSVIVYLAANTVETSHIEWDFMLAARIAKDGKQSVGITQPLTMWVTIYSIFLAAVVGTIGFAVLRRFNPFGHKLKNATLNDFTAKGRAKTVKDLRPTTLADTHHRLIDDNDVGSPIGKLKGKTIYSSWEDVELAVMAPRVGKTSALAVPKILAAPGACVVTSNKIDIVETTKTARETNGSTSWVFDPMAIAFTKQTWFWNPLTTITDFSTARDLAAMFITPQTSSNSSGGNQKFFEESAKDYLAYLLLAAKTNPNNNEPSIKDIDAWIDDRTGEGDATHILTTTGYISESNALAQMCAGPPETFGGIRASARTATICLKSATVTNWVTPQPGLQKFDTKKFLETSQDTLYLISEKDKSAAASPLIAAFVNEIFETTKAIANRNPSQRLDPPLVTILDEAANICKIPNLPGLYSHLGSRGVLVNTILQNIDQAKSVWGDNGFKQLWSAATIKIFGSGIDDTKTLEDISKLIGDHDTKTVSTNKSRQGTSQNYSQRKEAIMSPSKIRELAKDEAIIFATSKKPFIVNLTPWYKTKQKSQLNEDIEQQEKERQYND